MARMEWGNEKRVQAVLVTKGKLFYLLKRLELTITGVRGFKEAIITQGGVNVKEIDPGTMESKKVKGLYFAGEVLDLDAVTGGFNLQIAWSTGYLAGMN
jgi:predicted flavoprotein YhiN